MESRTGRINEEYIKCQRWLDDFMVMNRLAQAAFLTVVAVAVSAQAAPNRVTRARVVEALSKGDAQTAAQSFHYPPNYSAGEKAEDIAGVSKSLVFLLEQFGLPRNPTETHEPRSFFQVGSSGGNVPYWESISPYESRNVVYDVDFANFGRGVIVVEQISLGGGAQVIKGVEFGLLTDQPNSKKRIMNTFEGMLKHMGVELPPNFREVAAQQIQPVVAPGTPTTE
jgi:hypothetical protein